MRECEPDAFLAARENGTLAGYAIFTSNLRRVQWRAVVSGAVFGWIAAALRGGFAIRAGALGRILLNKLYFLRYAGKFRTSGSAQLLNIAVDPSMQGRGAGKLLLDAGMAVMRSKGVSEIRLEVRPWNGSAVHLYRKSGWQEAGRTRDAEGEWLVMIYRNTRGQRAVAQLG